MNSSADTDLSFSVDGITIGLPSFTWQSSLWNSQKATQSNASGIALPYVLLNDEQDYQRPAL